MASGIYTETEAEVETTESYEEFKDKFAGALGYRERKKELKRYLGFKKERL